ncbi:MAG TPA: hypothetical protein VMY35_00275 [Phycisphaerae bacterium]|nr:hypothetical protein [Phycisphaerae bacterium]
MRRRRCTLLDGIGIERGTRADWEALAPLHYRSHAAGAVSDIFRMVHRATGEASETLVGVIVYSRSPLSLSARNRATGGRYRVGRGASAGRLINDELRIVSRVVIVPNWRGLGLASRLVAETLPLVGTPLVEALAAMGRVHPFFEQAGMTAYGSADPPAGERLRAALESAGLDRADRRSAEALETRLAALAPEAQRLANHEIERWARSYLAAKNHRTQCPERRRMLELVARHLDSVPVYYLWRRADLAADARLQERGGRG